MQENEQVTLRGEIEATLHLIAQRQANLGTNLHVRFMRRAPTITATMFDGDVESREQGRLPQDASGRIRFQPQRFYGTIHEGVVMQFSKLKEKKPTPFDFYAEEVRQQWAHARPAFTLDAGANVWR